MLRIRLSICSRPHKYLPIPCTYYQNVPYLTYLSNSRNTSLEKNTVYHGKHTKLQQNNKLIFMNFTHSERNVCGTEFVRLSLNEWFLTKSTYLYLEKKIFSFISKNAFCGTRPQTSQWNLNLIMRFRYYTSYG